MSQDLIGYHALVALALVITFVLICPSQAGAESTNTRLVNPVFETIYRPICTDGMRKEDFDACWFAAINYPE